MQKQQQKTPHTKRAPNKTEKLTYTHEIERSTEYLQYRALSGLGIWIQLYIYGCTTKTLVHAQTFPSV